MTEDQTEKTASETEAKSESTGENKDLFTRLRGAGDDAIQKIGDVPGGKKVVEAVNGLLDEVQKRLKRVDELEKRVETLEEKAGVRKPDPPAETPAPPTSGSSAGKS